MANMIGVAAFIIGALGLMVMTFMTIWAVASRADAEIGEWQRFEGHQPGKPPVWVEQKKRR